MTAPLLTRVADGLFRLDGDLDFDTVSAVARLPEAAFVAPGELRIDLAGVTAGNSAGLALLLEWLAQARRRQRAIRFSNLPDPLVRLARLSNVEDLLGIGAEAQS